MQGHFCVPDGLDYEKAVVVRRRIGRMLEIMSKPCQWDLLPHVACLLVAFAGELS